MKIAVLISGGVDSSVALNFLQEQGHDVTAFYLKIWLEDELSFLGDCPWEEDLKYVYAVCKQMGVPLEIVPLQDEYWNIIVAYTIEQARAGCTPNPDILCNQHIKFGAFLNKIDNSFEKVATGHYAQVKEIDGKVALFKAPDQIKDQTYFLSRLNQMQLARVLFPIGHLAKSQVRSLAHQFDLPNKDRKDSQGICFLGKIKFDEFLKFHLGQKEGDIIEIETGKKLGKHPGYWFYTIGQRQGLGLAGGPWYVAAKSIDDNLVFVSRSYYAPDKIRDIFSVSTFNWLSGNKPEKKDMQVKIRHGASSYPCNLEFIDSDEGFVKLMGCDQGIASGQFAVFYDGEQCLGGGVIKL